MSFYDDLKFGEKYQQELIKILKPKNYKMMSGNFKEYDLIIDDIMPIYYEVKADRTAIKYGNICIEYKCGNNPSGIATTTADYYAYFVINKNDYDLYIIPVLDIKKMIKDNKYFKNVNGGDNKKASLYLFDISFFTKYKYIEK